MKEDLDFIEGVSSKLIRKDNNPSWRFKTVKEVPQAEVLKYFKSSTCPKISSKFDLLYLDDIDLKHYQYGAAYL